MDRLGRTGESGGIIRWRSRTGLGTGYEMPERLPKRHRRHDHPRRFREPRHGRYDPGGAICKRERDPFPRDLFWHADGPRGICTQHGRMERRGERGVRHRDDAPGHRPDAGAEGRHTVGWNDAARRLPVRVKARYTCLQAVRAGEDLGEAPPPLRGEQRNEGRTGGSRTDFLGCFA